MRTKRNKQCGYCTVCTFLNSEQEHVLVESLQVCTDCHLNLHVSAWCHSGGRFFSYAVSTLKWGQQEWCFSFHNQKPTKANYKTISSGWIVHCIFAWWMWRQSSLWNVTHYGLDCTKCIFNEGLKEILTINPFHNVSVQNFSQKKMRIYEEAKQDCWICYDTSCM